jgi:quercetin dioxygenase-like cupin family protein
VRNVMKSRPSRAATALCAAVIGVVLTVSTAIAADSSTTRNGITRTELGQATPANAPGQTLYLQRVTIAPGAKLARHFHEGTQVARIVTGVLTYDIASGTATVTRSNGKVVTYDAPATIRLRPGDTIVETADLVHHGENNGTRTVVIELASLLRTRAPLSTTVGTSASGAALHVVATLDSVSRTLTTVGQDGSQVYGWNQLAGTDGANGVGVVMLGNVNYEDGSGPIFGFVTFTFADGSTLGVQMQGSAVATADGTSTKFAATLGVIGGTGRYATAKGSGTFTGSRAAALGTTVSAIFDLTVTGATTG